MEDTLINFLKINEHSRLKNGIRWLVYVKTIQCWTVYEAQPLATESDVITITEDIDVAMNELKKG